MSLRLCWCLTAETHTQKQIFLKSNISHSCWNISWFCALLQETLTHPPPHPSSSSCALPLYSSHLILTLLYIHLTPSSACLLLSHALFCYSFCVTSLHLFPLSRFFFILFLLPLSVALFTLQSCSVWSSFLFSLALFLLLKSSCSHLSCAFAALLLAVFTWSLSFH